jgi:hypothetical protein
MCRLSLANRAGILFACKQSLLRLRFVHTHGGHLWGRAVLVSVAFQFLSVRAGAGDSVIV